MAEQPRSQQLPGWVEKFDVATFGPLGKHSFLCDEAVAPVGSALVEHVLGTFIPTSWLVVVVGDLPHTLGPGRRGQDKEREKLSLSIVELELPNLVLRTNKVIIVGNFNTRRDVEQESFRNGFVTFIKSVFKTEKGFTHTLILTGFKGGVEVEHV